MVIKESIKEMRKLTNSCNEKQKIWHFKCYWISVFLLCILCLKENSTLTKVKLKVQSWAQFQYNYLRKDVLLYRDLYQQIWLLTIIFCWSLMSLVGQFMKWINLLVKLGLDEILTDGHCPFFCWEIIFCRPFFYIIFFKW